MSAISSQELKAVIFASAAEQSAWPTFEAAGCIPCQSYPAHLSVFTDSEGEEFTARPDFYHPATDTYIEFKTRFLNSKKCIRTATNVLRNQYKHWFSAGEEANHLTHSQLSSRLWDSRHHNDCLLHAWNHSLKKNLIIQKTLGREKFLVVFASKLPEDKENRHYKAGLSFIYLKDLAAFLTV